MPPDLPSSATHEFPLPPERRWLVETPIAHRGLHGPGVPENSLAAFLSASRQGYAVEMDVQLLADGEVAVCHDDLLARLTGQDALLSRQTAASLKKYRLLETDEGIPLLSEVMDAFQGASPLLIEIKNYSARIGPLEQAVGALLARYNGPAAVMSFNPLTVGYFRTHLPQIARGQLSGLFGGGAPVLHAVKLWLARMPLNWWTRPHFAACDVELIGETTEKLRRQGLPILAWTVRTTAERERAARWADNIIFEEAEGG